MSIAIQVSTKSKKALVASVKKAENKSHTFCNNLNQSLQESIQEVGTLFVKDDILKRKVYELGVECAQAFKDGQIAKARLVYNWIKYKPNEDVIIEILRDHLWITHYVPKMKEKDITEPGSCLSWSYQINKAPNYSHMYGYWFCDKVAKQIHSAVLITFISDKKLQMCLIGFIYKESK
jgi:hypothetical protein